jgi:hypothetical protein
MEGQVKGKESVAGRGSELWGEQKAGQEVRGREDGDSVSQITPYLSEACVFWRGNGW